MNRDLNEKLIGLQYGVGVGADSFSGKSFWPGCISILIFPFDLRSKLHIGMHVISLCEGKCIPTSNYPIFIQNLLCIYTQFTLYLPTIYPAFTHNLPYTYPQ